ncbi:MAG: hypothetical protein AB7F89_16155 [Pirellulaceae bacterium]
MMLCTAVLVSLATSLTAYGDGYARPAQRPAAARLPHAYLVTARDNQDAAAPAAADPAPAPAMEAPAAPIVDQGSYLDYPFASRCCNNTNPCCADIWSGYRPSCGCARLHGCGCGCGCGAGCFGGTFAGGCGNLLGGCGSGCGLLSHLHGKLHGLKHACGLGCGYPPIGCSTCGGAPAYLGASAGCASCGGGGAAYHHSMPAHGMPHAAPEPSPAVPAPAIDPPAPPAPAEKSAFRPGSSYRPRSAFSVN